MKYLTRDQIIAIHEVIWLMDLSIINSLPSG